jgi:hypothetical protein
MIAKNAYTKVQSRLQSFLEEGLGDATVRIGDDIHYRGTNIIVTSAVFDGLLPEQRFHHVVRAIPQEFYEQHLQGGVVWFELSPGESATDLMKMPRSEDVAGQEAAIIKQLKSIGFAGKLRKKLGRDLSKADAIGFTASRPILEKAGLSEQDITRAFLLFILHGGFCDLQVAADVVPKILA